MTFLKRVFEDRQDLANTLRKYSGIRKVVEECYPDNAHFIYELLQNAEDAVASEASFELNNDSLIFTHDGKRSFTEDDVWSITNIGDSTLSGKIGKFGVGFKSVFAYSETPRIYCRTFSFEINNFVQPVELESRTDIGSKTRFEFPFNSPKKPRDRAFKETSVGLRGLSELALLFLSNLRVIHWRINQGPESTVSRVDHPNDHVQIDVATGTTAVKSSHWLRFSHKWKESDQKERSVAIAFAMSFLKHGDTFQEASQLAEQFKIVPVHNGTVFVFFPAVGENSGLRFHVHAPFATDVSRANVKDDRGNDPLYDKLKSLAATALHKLKGLNLLTPSFLAVLPNANDNLSNEFQPIRETILEELNDRALTPTRDGQFAPARRLVHAEQELKELLSKADLKLLLGAQDQDWNWAIDCGEGRQSQLLKSLAIREWGITEFQHHLIAEFQPRFDPEQKTPKLVFTDWFAEHSQLWHQQLYAILNVSPSSSGEDHPIAELPIVRLQGGDYAKGSECYFSSPSVEIPLRCQIKIVDKQVYSSGEDVRLHKRAKDFLKRIDVTEIQESHVIKTDLKTWYSKPDASRDDTTYFADLIRFMRFIKKNPMESGLFSATYIFKNCQNKWVTPREVYIDSPYKTTFLKAYYDCFGIDKGVRPMIRRDVREPLSGSYDVPEIPRENFISFAETIGVQCRLEIVASRCQDNPEWDTNRVPMKNIQIELLEVLVEF